MKLKLIIDFGNTLQKLAVFEGKNLVLKEIFQDLKPDQLIHFIEKNGPFFGIILSSVSNHPLELEKILTRSGKFILLDARTPVPIKNLYQTPESLGKDRIAAVSGAWSLFPGHNILAIDAGTCITYDFLTKNGEYLGGGISPGIRMRFQAMHTFTGKLPLIEPDDFDDLIGRSTRESLLSGVYNGATAEIRELIRLYQQKFNELLVIITGGDHQLLYNKLKISIFAAPDLVLFGLNEIFDYNDHAS
jgi:type III pantothenate kinase